MGVHHGLTLFNTLALLAWTASPFLMGGFEYLFNLVVPVLIWDDLANQAC